MPVASTWAAREPKRGVVLERGRRPLDIDLERPIYIPAPKKGESAILTPPGHSVLFLMSILIHAVKISNFYPTTEDASVFCKWGPGLEQARTIHRYADCAILNIQCVCCCFVTVGG